ncbi:MAG: CDP-alcohol phosphatidyltransferase family protein [Promethearchaeota archaeon]
MGVLKELKLKDYVTFIGTFCGFFSIMLSLEGLALRAASGFILIGVIMDFCDGYVARKTKQMNKLGKELDSLSDSLVFGIAPAILVVRNYTKPTLDTGVPGIPMGYMLFPAFIFILGAICRLAWFNIDKSEGYTGLVTPLSAITVVLLIHLDYYWTFIPGVGNSFANFMKYAVPLSLILIAYLNVCPYLIYGVNIRKKQGKIKSIFPFVIILGGITFPLGYMGFLLPKTSPYVCALLISMLGIIIAWILYGIHNYRVLKKINQTSTINNQKEQ